MVDLSSFATDYRCWVEKWQTHIVISRYNRNRELVWDRCWVVIWGDLMYLSEDGRWTFDFPRYFETAESAGAYALEYGSDPT